MQVWGIHNDTLTDALVSEGFISIGWDGIGDLRGIPGGRDGLKQALWVSDPESKPRAVGIWAGILYRFGHEIQAGDVVVAPYKPDSTINIGVVSGDYYFAGAEPTHRHRIPVAWKKTGLPRTVFTQPALYEIGSVVTLFKVTKHAAEFLAALGSEAAIDDVDSVGKDVDTAAAEIKPDDVTEEPRASRIERHTRDFLVEVLSTKISHREFEEFTADLLRAMGYQARVTAYNQDGGVDVIAHSDPLGVEPPQIKVQCKHRTATTGSPEVQQLIGSQGDGELSLFVTLGAYSRDALAIERQRPGLRLLSGEDMVSLVLQHYGALPARWRNLMPLTPVLVVDDSAD